METNDGFALSIANEPVEYFVDIAPETVGDFYGFMAAVSSHVHLLSDNIPVTLTLNFIETEKSGATTFMSTIHELSDVIVSLSFLFDLFFFKKIVVLALQPLFIQSLN